MLNEAHMEDTAIAPGLYADIHFEEYLGGPGISKHGLDLIARSPLHYQKYESVDSPGMALGRAVHCAILEPMRFAVDYIVPPQIDRRTKVGKSAWAEFLEQAQGKTLISSEDYEKVQRMAGAVHSHPAACAILKDGYREITCHWQDPENGLQCRCRPDYLNDEMTLIADLKTCASAAPGAFSRSVNNYRYHVQNAWYLDGLKALGCPVEYFVFICIENTPPHAVACYVLEPAAVDLGRELYRRDLNTFANCKKENHWPGYSEEVELLRLPNWAYKQSYCELEI